MESGKIVLSVLLGLVVARYLPRSLSYWIGLRAADMYHARHRAVRRAVAANIRQIMYSRGVRPSPSTVSGMARKTFQYYGKYLVDFFRYSTLSKRKLRRLVSIEHTEYLENSLAAGNGVILATAHFGNWELGGAILSSMGYDVYTVFLPERLRAVNRLFRRQRERRGVHVLTYGRAASGALRCLRQGNLLALLADRDFSHRDERLPFFGKPARLPRAPAALSMRTGAPVVPAFVIRQVDDTFLLRFHSPLRPEDHDSEKAMQAAIVSVMEEEIAAEPNQWFIFDDFWSSADSNGHGGVEQLREEETG